MLAHCLVKAEVLNLNRIVICFIITSACVERNIVLDFLRLSVCLSVRPSVCRSVLCRSRFSRATLCASATAGISLIFSPSDTLVLCDKRIEVSNLFLSQIPDSSIIPVSLGLSVLPNFKGIPSQAERQIHRSEKTLRFSTQVTVYLGNATR